MKSFHIVFLLCLVAVFRPASAQDATGYSSIEISDSGVTGIGSTQLDYTSAAYYEVGTSVVLFQGNTAQSLNVISQDNELAPRGLVSGYVSGPFIPNQVYEVLTSHYLRLIQIKGEVLNKPNDWTGIAPDGSVIVGDVNGNAQNKGPWRDLTN